MDIKGLNFKCTCSACPEQYDVFDSNDNIVGYVRLRWGGLTCEYPDVGGEYIYHASIGGDGWTGCFENDEQRMRYLNNIADKIIEKMNSCPYCTTYCDLPEHWVDGKPIGKVFDTCIDYDLEGRWHIELPSGADIGIKFCPMCGRELHIKEDF